LSRNASALSKVFSASASLRWRRKQAGRGDAQFRDWPLGPNLGQCCGGMVKTLTETFDSGDLPAVRRADP
jgi:hypothetical protein